MVEIQKAVSWISVSVILLIGIAFLVGLVPLPDSSFRWGFGIVIVLYAGIRTILMISRHQEGAKKP
jgi:membrane protein YdbS with pleckstrin-like domain